MVRTQSSHGHVRQHGVSMVAARDMFSCPLKRTVRLGGTQHRTVEAGPGPRAWQWKVDPCPFCANGYVRVKGRCVRDTSKWQIVA